MRLERSGDGDGDGDTGYVGGGEKTWEKKKKKKRMVCMMQGKKGKRIKNTIKCYQNISQ